MAAVVSASSPRFVARRIASRKSAAPFTAQIAASRAWTQNPLPRIAGGSFARQLPRAIASISGWSSSPSQNAAAHTFSHGSPRMSEAVMAARTRQASTGRRAGWVGRLDSAAIRTTVSGSCDQRMLTGASRISDPLAAASSSTVAG